MSLSLYNEVMEDDQCEARRQERLAVLHAISLLELARQKGVGSREAIDALYYLDRLWSLFMDDLSHPENGLPQNLRASLISIGIWILREIENIRLQRSTNLEGLIEISHLISKGLS